MPQIDEIAEHERSATEDPVARYPEDIFRLAVPSLFTLMNLFSGFLAITQIHKGEFEVACYLMVLACFFDVLDGMMARLAQGQSRFGIELDSLSDIVSFGVAPSYLVYAFVVGDYGIVGLIASAFPVLCAAVRLARYNVGYGVAARDGFSGLPVPVQALAVVSLVLNGEDAVPWFPQGLASDAVLLSAVFVLSALMVSRIAFEGTPRPTSEYLSAKPLVASGYAAGIFIIIVWREFGLLIAVAAYILVGILRAIWYVIRAIRRHLPPRP